MIYDEEQARRAYETYAGALGIDRSQGGKSWDDLPAALSRT
jgi:hypothetical protein